MILVFTYLFLKSFHRVSLTFCGSARGEIEIKEGKRWDRKRARREAGKESRVRVDEVVPPGDAHIPHLSPE
eukprot:1333660-Amorphochlora_amoeboformis.AAC.1